MTAQPARCGEGEERSLPSWLEPDDEKDLFVGTHARGIDPLLDTVPAGTAARLEAAEGLRQHRTRLLLETLSHEGRVLDCEQIRPISASYTPRARVTAMWRIGLWPMKVVAASAGVSEKEAWRLMGVTEMSLGLQRSRAVDAYELAAGHRSTRDDAERELERQRAMMFCTDCGVFVETRDVTHAEVVARLGPFVTVRGHIERACVDCERQLWRQTVALHSRIPPEPMAHMLVQEFELTAKASCEAVCTKNSWEYHAVLVLTVRCSCGCGMTVSISKRQLGERVIDARVEVVDPAHVCVPAPRRPDRARDVRRGRVVGPSGRR